MGNTKSRKEVDTLYTPDELRVLETAYRNSSSGPLEKLSSEKLVESWSQTIERGLAVGTAQFLFMPTKQGQHSAHIPLRRFSEPFYIMERGTIDMKVQMLLGSMDKVGPGSFNVKELEQYIYHVVKSYIHLESTAAQSYIKEWHDNGYATTERSAMSLTKGLLRNLDKNVEITMPVDKLENWLQITPQFLQIWREVFLQLYARHGGSKRSFIKDSEVCILPKLCDGPHNPHYRPIMEMPHVLFINSNIPHELRHKWRFLFSSKIHGESFSTMLGKITDKGPTLFLIEDEDQHIFGGFAPESWALRPQFVGNDTSVLFTLSPAVRCFGATGYNDHYQYLNLNQQTMPNGLGMGGQFEFWGLWIDSMFGEGQSAESCSTYRDYVQLSKRKQFKIRNLEVWAVGDLPVKDTECDEDSGTKRSVLDKNIEDRAMLEIAGKHMHSDGLREPEMDQ